MGKGRLENLNALITGGSRGIGLAIARRFAEEGANLFICGRSRESLEKCANELRQTGHKAVIHTADVSDPGSVQEMVEHVLKEFKTVDILVNNAGIQIVRSFLDYTLEEFDQVIKTNLYGLFLVTRSVLPGMIEGKKGRIVNIASTAGKWGSRNQSAYNASKHAVVGLTRCLGLEVAPFNITVNAICPGAVEGTDMMEPFLEQNSKYYGIPKENLLGMLLTQSPMRRLIRPAEVADLAVYLASDESAGMTCQSIALCTGYTMV
jgi:meso-butanediol dehydrogenase / (S,S)-butanediol dehydrogenase / diacetyl reductase